MYTLISALLREKGGNKQHNTVDISAMNMFDLLSRYVDGYISLSHPSLKVTTYLSLTTLRSNALPIKNVTFSQWLAYIGNVTIPSDGNTLKVTKNSVVYADAFQYGYSIRRVYPTDISPNSVYPTADKTDAFIFKTISSQDVLANQCLTTVNGLLHLNIPISSGLQIKNAGSTLDISQKNHIGILSFENIGDVEQVKITQDMIMPADSVYGYSSAVYLKLNSELTNKSILFSFCGRLYGQQDGIVTRCNDQGLIRIDLCRLDLIQLVQDLKTKINMSSLKLDERIYQMGGTKISDVMANNDVIVAMLLLMQTFIVLVDTPTLIWDTITMTPSKLEGIAETMYSTNLPMVNSKKEIVPYWKRSFKTTDGKVFRFYLDSTQKVFPLYKTTDPDEMKWINSTNMVEPASTEIPTLLNLHSETIQVF